LFSRVFWGCFFEKKGRESFLFFEKKMRPIIWCKNSAQNGCNFAAHFLIKNEASIETNSTLGTGKQ
jgi:hypothetical protein